MSADEKPLPKPPGSPFGRKRHFDQDEEKQSLMADRLAMAAAEGRLEEFMKDELPDHDYAKNLAAMMLGMTGMVPPEGVKQERQQTDGASVPQAEQTDDVTSGQPSEEVLRAVQQGDVKGLMELLAQEHRRRMPDAGQAEGPAPSSSSPAPQGVIDRELIDRLLRIASENSVTPDWIMMRALKLYVEEYQRSGRL